MDRQIRGQRIAKTPGGVCHSPKGIGWFRVRSSSERLWYEVNIVEQTCTCPDFAPKCKHLYAAEQFAQRIPRPKNLGPPTFVQIEREVNQLLRTVEAALRAAQGQTDSWREHEEIDEDLASLRIERRALKAHLREFSKTLAASDEDKAATQRALEIIARHVCPREMMQHVAQMALDGYSTEQITEYVQTGQLPSARS